MRPLLRRSRIFIRAGRSRQDIAGAPVSALTELRLTTRLRLARRTAGIRRATALVASIDSFDRQPPLMDFDFHAAADPKGGVYSRSSYAHAIRSSSSSLSNGTAG